MTRKVPLRGTTRLPRDEIFSKFHFTRWAGRDSNPRRPKPSDLQSDAIVHSATCPQYLYFSRFLPLEPERGIGPPTYCLQNSCSTIELLRPISSWLLYFFYPLLLPAVFWLPDCLPPVSKPEQKKLPRLPSHPAPDRICPKTDKLLCLWDF